MRMDMTMMEALYPGDYRPRRVAWSRTARARASGGRSGAGEAGAEESAMGSFGWKLRTPRHLFEGEAPMEVEGLEL